MGRVGFTLIELLVVVLIIAVLASVALPQYNKAVRKARAMSQVAVLSAIYPAVESCWLRTGDMSQCSIDQLELDFDPTCEIIDPAFTSCDMQSYHYSDGGTRVQANYRVDNHPTYGSDSLQIIKYNDKVICIGGGSKGNNVYVPLCEQLGFTKSCGEENSPYSRCL